MSTRGQFNTKSPTIKRILKEASELASNASPDFHAEPLEDDLFEWHFTIKGPPEPSPYHTGIYHGRIVLPAQYPLRPPAFRFLTPSGRFEVNREICLSISGHHEETWQPAWGIRTAMVAIRSFMDTDAKGQLGGIECSPEIRTRMAGESVSFKCAVCAKSNAQIMKEREEAAALQEAKAGKKKEESVPEELRLAYRDELAESSASWPQHPEKPDQSTKVPSSTDSASQNDQAERPAAPEAPAAPISASTSSPLPTRTLPPQPPIVVQANAGPPLAWVDACIYGVLAALLFMVIRKVF
ncbi:UBC-like protein [Sporormia fimetaria CBS 119925]|uniref:UBC-like protein n=1 Tax=Sporormia fimetaria CBS 119925 TaxID=1340428 RepID=A0A6A6V155_9PLEO|nr:UBC-like protein [Sporormia fimetaria CBS 119925]